MKLSTQVPFITTSSVFLSWSRCSTARHWPSAFFSFAEILTRQPFGGSRTTEKLSKKCLASMISAFVLVRTQGTVSDLVLFPGVAAAAWSGAPESEGTP